MSFDIEHEAIYVIWAKNGEVLILAIDLIYKGCKPDPCFTVLFLLLF
jgi:hypothetical protein